MNSMLRGLAKTGIACALHWTGSERLIGALTGTRNAPLTLDYHRVVEDYTASPDCYTPAMLTRRWTLERSVAEIKQTPLILCYHRVVEDFDMHAKNYIPYSLISRRMLARQLDWIGRRFRFISLDELGPCLARGETSVAAITFDDGYSDVYRYAFPFLKQRGIPSAVFAVTELIGTRQVPIYDRLYLLLMRAFSRWRSAGDGLARMLHKLDLHPSVVTAVRHKAKTPFLSLRTLQDILSQAETQRVVGILEAEVGMDEALLKELYPLDWEMLTEMHHSGVTIGSHTRTHALLTHETPQKVIDEIVGSRRELEKQMGIAIQHFAYPDGRFNPRVVSAVAASGYRFGYTICSHRDSNHPWLTIPRLPLWENSCLNVFRRFSPAVMSCYINRIFDFIGGCRQDHKVDGVAE